MSYWCLEDFTVGRKVETTPVKLEVDEIIWFAEQYDPQPFHIDEEAAKDSIFGGLIGSGFQTVAIATGQFLRTGILDGSNLGGPGLDKVRWIAPVRPGDTLSTELEVLEARASKSNPARGIVRLGLTVSTESGVVATFETVVIVHTRNAATA